jgi:heterotetrameric sarcosine oxidase gamma subunit
LSLEFLTPGAAQTSDRFSPVARSSMDRLARAAGAQFETRDGWLVAVAYGTGEQESQLLACGVGFADVSHLGKLELQTAPEQLRAIMVEATGEEEPPLGQAVRADGAWWCPMTSGRLLAVCEPSASSALLDLLQDAVARAQTPASLVDVTSAFAALAVAGPLARELFARFCALDLRPDVCPVGAVRPGSVARQPGVILREASDRFLLLYGWAVGEYIWTQVEEAARHLGGGPVGVDALARLDPHAERIEEVRARA